MGMSVQRLKSHKHQIVGGLGGAKLPPAGVWGQSPPQNKRAETTACAAGRALHKTSGRSPPQNKQAEPFAKRRACAC